MNKKLIGTVREKMKNHTRWDANSINLAEKLQGPELVSRSVAKIFL